MSEHIRTIGVCDKCGDVLLTSMGAKEHMIGEPSKRGLVKYKSNDHI